MPDKVRRREAFLPAAGFFVLIFLWSFSLGGAQELPLKRTLPGSEGFSCPGVQPGPDPSPEEQAQARVLGSNADQALILGDQVRARDLLTRAVELDPSSPELAYRYARALEDLGETEPAIDQFCRSLALGAQELGIEDAQPRLEALVRSVQPQVPDEAKDAFSNGLTQADLGNSLAAIAAFGTAFDLAPDWADAVYNRGVIWDRQGEIDEAVTDLQRYLSLNPEGADAIAVSQRIGQLQSAAPLPGAGATFTLGLLIPGMGQFYSGRALGGFSVLALAGGALATGFLVEEIQTKCIGSVPASGECPPERIISQETTKPYSTQSLIVAGAVTVLGALEAALKVRRGGSDGNEDLSAFDRGSPRILGPSVSVEGSRLNLNLVRVSF